MSKDILKTFGVFPAKPWIQRAMPFTELKRRALEVENKSSDKRTKWELSRPKDMEPDIFRGKEEAWSKFKEDLMDYADAVHPGINCSWSGR